MGAAQDASTPGRPIPDLSQARGDQRVTAGRVGDRAIAVCATIEELTSGIRRATHCPDRVQ
jgi:hypothetical protein